MRVSIIAGGLLAAALAGPGAAKSPDEERTPLLGELVACRTIPGAAERLACFDRAVARVDESERRGDLLVTDRAAVQRSKRSLFGLSLPSFDLFRRKGVEADEVREIEAVLAGASYSGLKWTFVLADGARWRQTEVQSVIDPRKGEKVLIRRAAMGSYLLKVAGRVPAVRVERVN